MKSDAFDYEGILPGRGGRDRESAAKIEAWPKAGKLKHFDDPEYVPVPAPAPPVAQTTKRDSSLMTSAGNWIRRRGHTLSFVALFIFSIVLYLRPYELIPALSSFTSMAYYTGVVTLAIYFATQLSLEGNLTDRPREINLVLLIGLAALLSMPMAEDPGGAWKTFTDMLLKTLIIFIVFVNVVRTEWRLKLLIFLILGVSIYLAINALDDYRAGVFSVGAAETHDLRIAGRIKGLFENSNDLALHLVTMIPITVGLGLITRNPLKRLIYFGIAALMVAGVTVTFSRGGFIGLVAMTFVLVRRLGKKNRVATMVALVFAVILFIGLAPGAFTSRVSTIFNSAADVTGSSSQRTEVLKRSFWVTLRYPIFGVGIGNFHYKSPRNLETHNAYTQVSSELGIAAMVIYIMFLVHPLRRMRLIENETDTSPDQRTLHYLAIAFQAAIVGFMFASFFGAVAYQWYVYYLVGYAVCLHRIYLAKFPPADGFARERWLAPFSKNTQRLIGGATVGK
ncbi:MAG TPA: O-antigen ligase family protein [Pyrinomonadaceae bacterium]|jgi:O-antigen ligase|nr:O-antigen ligase family protein [Pyrinomonadaceae bacterium]